MHKSGTNMNAGPSGAEQLLRWGGLLRCSLGPCIRAYTVARPATVRLDSYRRRANEQTVGQRIIKRRLQHGYMCSAERRGK